MFKLLYWHATNISDFQIIQVNLCSQIEMQKTGTKSEQLSLPASSLSTVTENTGYRDRLCMHAQSWLFVTP